MTTSGVAAGSALAAAWTLAVFALAAPVQAAPSGQISKLSDVTFTNLDPTVQASASQSVCVYSLTGLYSVTATGDGASSAFTLSAGGAVPVLPYAVAWSQSGSQSNGTALSSGTPLTGLTTLASGPLCAIGLFASASLIVSLAPADLQQATAGITYSGVLTLTIRAL